MPDPTQIDIPADLVIASLKAQLAEKCGEVAIAQALAQQLAQEKDAAMTALAASRIPPPPPTEDAYRKGSHA